MSGKTSILACAVAVVATACAQPTAQEIDLGGGREFVRYVADFYDDVGVAPSIALDKDGNPYIAAFAFTAALKEGQLPVQRPIGAPSLPAVTLTTVSGGIWTRGAVAMQAEVPNVDVAFGPAILKQLKGATSSDVNGTSVAIDGQGVVHAVWASDDGYWYASNAGGSFQATRILPTDPSTGAGSLGWPSVAVDPAGTPWVALNFAAEGGMSVRVGTLEGDRWRFDEVDRVDPCGGCPQPQRAAVGIDGDGNPFVVYAHPSAQIPMIARSSDGKWEEGVPIEKRGGGIGLSMAVDKDGNPHVAYYTPKGDEVRLAVATASGWSVGTVATLVSGAGAGPLTTSIAVDDQGTNYVGWYDPASDSVKLANGGSAFSEVPLHGTNGGDSPAVAVTPDASSVYLAWYDRTNGDLALGVFGETKGLELAQPSPTAAATGVATTSPTTQPSQGPAPCEPKGTTITVVAPPNASVTGFEEKCYAVPAGEKVTIVFDNQDPGMLHNFSVYTDSTAASQLYTTGQPVTGPNRSEFQAGPFDPGQHFFRCDVHPTTMTGTLVVK